MSGQGPPRPPDDIASAFQQTPTITIVLEGPELRIAAWNAAAERFLEPVLAGVGGASMSQVDWMTETGARERLGHLLQTGEPFSADGWRIALPGAAGQVDEVYLDFTFTPWRHPDGSIRGIIGTATDATLTGSRRPQDAPATTTTTEAEATTEAATSWQQRFEVSRDAMIALQAALLPATVPVVPGLQLAARYMVAEADTAAGGDWFSAYPTTSGRVALVVGDVVGHGVSASATMGQLRAVIKERLRSGAPLQAALQALDDYASVVPDADATTVCAGLLDPITGELEYCTAGHPPPLLVHGDSWRYLEQTGAGPLGSGRPFTTLEVSIPEDALLLLYSDGLIERPGTSRTESSSEIGQVVTDALGGRPIIATACAYPADRVCELSLELLTRTSGIADDITMLAVHRIPPVADLAARVTVEPGAVTAAVGLIDEWLDAIGAGRSDRLHLRHAVVEIVANSVEHGFAEGRDRDDGLIDLSAHLRESGEAVIDLVDNGRWKDPGQASNHAETGRLRGLGLPLAQQLLDSLTVRHDHTGTQVRIAHHLKRPAPIVSTPAMQPSESALASLEAQLEMTSDADTPDTILVHGPLLSTTAERLQTRLDIAGRAGTRSLTVNLDGVTHLTSAAVRVLQQAQRAAHRHDNELILTARPGTIASDVLHLLNVPVNDPEYAHR